MLELLAKRCLDRNQTPYFIKGVESIKDIFEREREIDELKPGDNVYITAKFVKMVDSRDIDQSDTRTDLVWIKDIFSDPNGFIIEVGGNRMLSTFNFKRQWLKLLSNKTKPKKVVEIKNQWPYITERSSDLSNLGYKMIGWEPPKIEDYRVKAPTLFHYSDPLFQEKQDIREAAYLQSVASYNTRVNNFYQVLAHACIMGKVVAFHMPQDQIIKLVGMANNNRDDDNTIILKNMITNSVEHFDFFKDIELIESYIMHDHFVIHSNIGLITSRNMEELFET